MPNLRQIADGKTLEAYGTSEGVQKEWDTRGRGKGKGREPGAAWYHHSQVGSYHLYQGAGTRGGQWMAKGRGERKVFDSLRQAQDHAHASSTDLE